MPIHVASAEYDLAGFVADPSSISEVVEFDRHELGVVTGKTLLHLQCHIGRDTLSWARPGAIVTGLNFSPEAIAAARDLSTRSGTPGRFIFAELYDAPDALPERFDIVYTSVGALNWLPDIRGWAKVVSRLLKPGGTLYVRDGHPMLWSVDDERDDDLLALRHPYFETLEPLRSEGQHSYAGGDALTENTFNYEWNHGLGEVVTVVIDAGMRLEFLHEHTFADYQGLQSTVRGGEGR